jgi:hypothetical protein
VTLEERDGWTGAVSHLLFPSQDVLDTVIATGCQAACAKPWISWTSW